MKKVDFAAVIHETISRCNQNRIGPKPHVFVVLSPVLNRLPWRYQSAEEFIRRFLYETLLTSDADAAVEVSLRRRAVLNDLKAFVGVEPSYWIQLRVAGRGIRVAENLIDDLFSEVGLRAEEWLGSADANTRLGIFGTIDAPRIKMVFCLESARRKQRCDLLLPVVEDDPAPERLGHSATV
jgi:hypothetical protein